MVLPEPDVETPCISVCQLDPALRQCVGCGRTIDEIGRWSRMTPVERRAVMAQLPVRLAQIKTEAK
jgi:predicted Fe-S protein YdhL (DUF1289 family)